jgi:hypothetical protein
VSLGWVGLGYVTLRYVRSTVCKVCFVFDFILHSAYTVDAGALTSLLTSLSFILRRIQKRRRRRFRASASIFRSIWISLLHNVVNRVLNRTAQFRCVFDNTNCHLNFRSKLRIWICTNFLYTTLFGVEFCKVWVRLG